MCIFAYNSEFAIVKVLSITQAPAICGTTFTHRQQYIYGIKIHIQLYINSFKNIMIN